MRYFEWMNPKSGARERISIDNGIYQREVGANKWKQIDFINIDKSISNDLPDYIYNYYFDDLKGENIIFTVSGTGYVFEFNYKNKSLKRLDKTFFKGYNFSAPQFIRNDTIYSIGGYGFWGYSRAITYYSDKLREWNEIRTRNFGPDSFVEGYQGYSKKTDKFYSGAPYKLLSLIDYKREVDDNLFAFDFKTLEWSIIGKINSFIPFRDENPKILWDGSHFLHFSATNIYLSDPIENKLYLVQNPKHFFHTRGVFHILGDTIYNYYENRTTVIKVSKKQLLKEAKYLGKFYESDNQLLYQYSYIALILSVLGIFSFFIFKRKTKFLNSMDGKSTHFNKLEIKLLKFFIEQDLKENKYVSVLQFNEILNLDNKSPENQRRMRNKFLKDLNLKFLLNYNINEAVTRYKSDEDNRLVLYRLKEEAKSHVEKLVS